MASGRLLDPTKAGKYPVILSDALLGKDSGELYTGVRCKHLFLSSPFLQKSSAGWLPLSTCVYPRV